MGARAALLGGLAAFGVAAGVATAGAGPTDASAVRPGAVRRLRDTPRLLGDPGGLRSDLEARGLAFDLFWNHQLGALVRGDQADEVAQSGSMDLFVRADLGALDLPLSTRFLLHVKSNDEANVNADTLALADVFDDADFDEAFHVAQLWFEQGFLDERVRLRAGRIEQQVVIDRNAYANAEDLQFMNAFLDNNPLVPLKSGLGAALFLQPVRCLELAVGVADGDGRPRQTGFQSMFDDFPSLVAYAELTLHAALAGPRGRLPGSYRVGLFRDGSERAVFGRQAADGGPRTRRGHLGLWVSLDQLLWRERAEDDQGLGAFLRYAFADERVSRLEQFFSAGFQYAGLLPGRDADVLGVGAYHTRPSSVYQRWVDPTFGAETALEAYYRIQVLPWLALTPDVQLVVDPGGLERNRNAVVLGLRTRVRF